MRNLDVSLVASTPAGERLAGLFRLSTEQPVAFFKTGRPYEMNLALEPTGQKRGASAFRCLGVCTGVYTASPGKSFKKSKAVILDR
jgi:hypothetical protein